MLQLRLITPRNRTDLILRELVAEGGAISVVVHRGAAVKPEGDDVIVADVTRTAVNALLARLHQLDIEEHGERSVIEIDAARSDAAKRALSAAPGRSEDILVWDVLDERLHREGVPSLAFYCFMAVAALIATVGIVIDSSVLIVGAMVVGPEYGPLAALAVGIYRRRPAEVRSALGVVVSGLALAVVTATILTFVFELLDTGIVEPQTRFFTGFVTQPNAYSAIVAFAAGLVGVMAMGLGRSGALTGVVVSATTIPAAAAIGVSAAEGAWHEARGGVIQLVVNVLCLTLGSLAALLVYQAVWTRIDELPAGPS